MRIDVFSTSTVGITLSRRNLASLLAKLDGYPKDSACTICCAREGMTVVVSAEPDEEHYGSRDYAPGRMHDKTEEAIAV